VAGRIDAVRAAIALVAILLSTGDARAKPTAAPIVARSGVYRFPLPAGMSLIKDDTGTRRELPLIFALVKVLATDDSGMIVFRVQPSALVFAIDSEQDAEHYLAGQRTGSRDLTVLEHQLVKVAGLGALRWIGDRRVKGVTQRELYYEMIGSGRAVSLVYVAPPEKFDKWVKAFDAAAIATTVVAEPSAK
jgi:hypothetical protein